MDKENEHRYWSPSAYGKASYHNTRQIHSHLYASPAPITPGRKRIKQTAVTTSKKQHARRVPLSSKLNRTRHNEVEGTDHVVLNPFSGCDVSLQGDHPSVSALAPYRSHLHHVGGPIHDVGPQKVPTTTSSTYHEKIIPSTSKHSKRVGVDGTYKTPSKELLRSTACSRGHRPYTLTSNHNHEFHHDDQQTPNVAMTTGGKKKKAKELHRHKTRNPNDISLHVPHVTFRGQTLDVDNTFDADLADDISALSIHLDCNDVLVSNYGCAADIHDDGELDSSLEINLLIKAPLDDEESERSRDPVATTLDVKDFLSEKGSKRIKGDVQIEREIKFGFPTLERHCVRPVAIRASPSSIS